MSEDEKQLVKKFKNLYIKDFNNEHITSNDRLSYIECALLSELIEKLEKELQQEKEKNKKLQIRGKELIEEKQELNTALLYDNISKDKIRAKIKELEEKSDYWNCDEIEVLKELLEE